MTSYVLKILCTVGIAATLTSCASTPKQASCNCSGYLPKKPRPAWAQGDAISGGNYRTAGLSQCTGLQNIDFERADLSARNNLALIVSAHVQSDVKLTQKDYGNGTGHSNASIERQQRAEQWLPNSVIYERWLDPVSCTIYAAAKVSEVDIKHAVKTYEAAQAALRVNQHYLVKVKGNQATSIKRAIETALNKHGVQQLGGVANSKSYTVNATVSDERVLNNSQLLRANLHLAVNSPGGQTLWSQTLAIKGIAFSPQPKNELLQRAIRDGLDQIEPALVDFLNQDSRQQ